MSVAPSRNCLLQISVVSHRFDGQEALRDLNFEISKDDRILLVGPNGSGKSTLLKILAGIITPSKGRISWSDNQNSDRYNAAYFGEDAQLYRPLSVEENLRLFRDVSKQSDELGEVFSSWNLDSYAGVAVQNLSRGTIVRASLARAFSLNRPLLILDEPTNALDATGREILINNLHGSCSRNSSTIIATHDLGFAAGFINRVIAIKSGSIKKDLKGSFTRDQLLKIYEESCL